MELMGNLKDKVSKAKDKEEARGLIEKAGMKLTDDELDKVAGGKTSLFDNASTRDDFGGERLFI